MMCNLCMISAIIIHCMMKKSINYVVIVYVKAVHILYKNNCMQCIIILSSNLLKIQSHPSLEVLRMLLLKLQKLSWCNHSIRLEADLNNAIRSQKGTNVTA